MGVQCASYMPLPLPFHVIAKPSGSLCNLDCTYCYYLEKEKLYSSEKQFMSSEVLRAYIRQYISAQPTDVIQFSWQGGEPTLLGIDFFREVVNIQREFGAGKKIENVLQTNGVLLDDRWGVFLSEHNFLVGISIDGPRRIHDQYRLDKAGYPTYERVAKAITVLKKHSVTFNTLTVVNRHNASEPLTVYRFLKSIGSEYMQFIPLVERKAPIPGSDGLNLVAPDFEGDAEVTNWSVEPVQFGSFLCTIFDEWVRYDVGRVYVQLFEVALEIWYGLGSRLCAFQEDCGRALVIESCGDVYSCDHFVYPKHKLGNILQQTMAKLASSPKQRAFGATKRDTLPRLCRECDVRFACNGECPKHRFSKTSEGEPGLNYLCPAYKRFFHHIDPYMRFMVSELTVGRAPANVMRMARRNRI
ncbi:MAG TPA: anaerobic sulfatase maturase [Terriglobales bacterium]|nr:anaerobic sulfatase maturase [Terriglobales bacterium]